MPPRFLTPAEVAEVLNVKVPQVMALIAGGDLISIQIGGRGVHRIEDVELEAYIQRQYDKARAKREARPDSAGATADESH